MSLGAPLALLGLLALPLVWWFHRRLRRPPEVVLPSLMFLQDEDDASKLPSGRRFDAELLLALVAVALLAFAAAEPVFVKAKPRRVVRVVVSGGAPAGLDGYAAAVRAATDEIRAALLPEDELELRWVPDSGAMAPRPSDETLLGLAMAGAASARVVISDRAPLGETGAIRWIAVGSPKTSNTGIVGVSVHQAEEGPELFGTVAHHGPASARVRIGLAVSDGMHVEPRWDPLPLEIAPGGVATFRFPLQEGERLPLSLDIRQPDGEVYDDDLLVDDGVELERDVLRVYLHPGVTKAHAQHVRTALTAILGKDGYREVARDERTEATLVVLPRGTQLPAPAALTLELESVEEGAPAERAPEGADGIGQDPLVRDLSTAGVEWIYAKGAADGQAGERVLLGRRVGDRVWPVLLAKGRVLRLAPDPLRGEPRAVDAPFWPLLIDNVVAAAVGRGVGGGYRARGLLDPASTKPGAARIPFDASALSGVRPSVPGRERPLRPLLVACALVCLLLLWAAPRIRRRLAARPALASVGA